MPLYTPHNFMNVLVQIENKMGLEKKLPLERLIELWHGNENTQRDPAKTCSASRCLAPKCRIHFTESLRCDGKDILAGTQTEGIY
jgi:hypothetical protein